MFPEPVEASIDLLLHLFHRFRRRVPDLLFDIAVAVLFRIQFRRIGRKPFDTDLSFRRQILFDNTRAMGLRSVPNHDQRLLEAGSQMAQHSHHLRPANRLPVMTLINTPVDGQCNDCRDLSPLAFTSQEGRLPARRPSTGRARLETESSFVHKDDQCLPPPGLFLIRGQCSWSHCVTNASSRSRATRTACWTLQPELRSFSLSKAESSSHNVPI